jgi:hypothetical protein
MAFAVVGGVEDIVPSRLTPRGQVAEGFCRFVGHYTEQGLESP